MTVSTLHPPMVTGCVAAARESMVAAAAVPAGGLPEEELIGVLSDLFALESQVASFRLELVAEADRRKMAERTADPVPPSGPRG